MTVCRNCGTDNIPSNRFCNRCGAELGMPPMGSMNEYPSMGNNAQPGGYNPGMNQMPQYQQQPYPPQQYPPQQYGNPAYPAQQYPPQQYQQQPYPPQQNPQQQFGQRPPMPTPYMQRPMPVQNDNTISVELSQREKALLQAYAQFNNIPMEEFVRKAAMEKLTVEFDKKSADSAYRAFMDNPETYTLEEVMESYDL